MSAPRQPSAEYADAPVPEAAAKHLQLAAAMLGRAGSQGKLTQLAHLQLYDAVLLRQQKHAERLALLDDAQHGALMADEVARHRERAVLLERLGRYAEAQPLLASLLREHTPDAWATHAAHLRCALARTAAAEGGTAAEEAAGTVRAEEAAGTVRAEGAAGTVRAEEAAGTVRAEEAAGTVRAEGAAGTVRTPLGEARELLAKLQLEHPTLRGPWLASLALELHALAPLAARELLGTAPGAVPGANPLAARELLGTAPDAPFGVAASVLAAAAAAAATAEAEALGARGGAGCAELVSQLQSYYKRYGDRAACVLDTAPCLRALRYVTAAQASLLELLEPQVLAGSSAGAVSSAVTSAVSSAGAPAADAAAAPEAPCRAYSQIHEIELTLPQLRRYIGLCQYRLGCGATASLTLGARRDLATEFMQVYFRSRPLSASLDSRERGHADNLPLMGAQLLLPRAQPDWFACGGASVTAWPVPALLQASLMLRLALDAAPHNFQLMLALMHCLEALGAGSMALELYKRCDIKQIQHETLSYVVLPALAQLGASDAADEALTAVRRFEQHGLAELPEQLLLAFRKSNYPQALEFVAFERSVRPSWWH